ncbi:MAG TPA: DNA-binding protein [Firmicutes bacterium]|nr:DNA-binding protein [Bacillota bacterium]
MKENLIKTEMNVNNEKISVMRIGNEEYISLTDLAKYANPTDPSGVIRNWMSNKNSFEFYSLWEELNNENFNSVESHRIKIEEVGYNRFTMTPSRWKKDFNAIGIIPSSGKYSAGTFAHSDIALEFASWLSPEFKLYLIKEFERLKRNEAYQEKIDWNASRILSKANYKIHTDAIKKSIVPNLVTDNQKKHAYSTEADLLNVALFGMTAKEWKDKNSGLKGNQRDYADIRQLLVLCNLETINATMINDKIAQPTRLEKLNKIAIEQLKILENDENLTKLKTTEFMKIENK